jgi:hypothetical protein
MINALPELSPLSTLGYQAPKADTASENGEQQ